ncbi:hypothetical protein D3C86_1125260 [compost metagenome]
MRGQVLHHRLGDDQRGVDALDGLDGDLLRRQVLDVGRVGQVQREVQLAFALGRLPADGVDAERRVARQQLAAGIQHGLDLLVLQAFVFGLRHDLAQQLVVGVGQLLDGLAVQLGQLDHGLAVTQRHVVHGDVARLIGGLHVDVLVVFGQLHTVAEIVQRQLDVVALAGDVDALDLQIGVAHGHAELAHAAVDVHGHAGDGHDNGVVALRAVDGELVHHAVRGDGFQRTVERAGDHHAAEVDRIALQGRRHRCNLGRGAGGAAVADHGVADQGRDVLGQGEHFLQVVRLGDFGVHESQLGRQGAARQRGLGEGAVFNDSVELDHAGGHGVHALVVLHERQAVARLGREQAAFVLDLVNAQTEQRRQLGQLFVGFGQMALRAFLYAFAGVPSGAYPASRSHYDHAEGDRYALFHRFASSLIVESYPAGQALSPHALVAHARLPAYTHSWACKGPRRSIPTRRDT